MRTNPQTSKRVKPDVNSAGTAVPAGLNTEAKKLKTSKLQRKFVNQMRSMSDVPWPARRYKYAPTFGNAGRTLDTGETCRRQVDEAQVRRRLRRKRTVAVLCGGRLLVKRGNLAKRRVYCESCRSRKAQRKLELRITQQLNRFGRVEPRAGAREERRTTRLLAKFRRSGSR